MDTKQLYNKHCPSHDHKEDYKIRSWRNWLKSKQLENGRVWTNPKQGFSRWKVKRILMRHCWWQQLITSVQKRGWGVWKFVYLDVTPTISRLWTLGYHLQETVVHLERLELERLCSWCYMKTWKTVRCWITNMQKEYGERFFQEKATFSFHRKTPHEYNLKVHMHEIFIVCF
jgi:hypothetical protein